MQKSPAAATVPEQPSKSPQGPSGSTSSSTGAARGPASDNFHPQASPAMT